MIYRHFCVIKGEIDALPISGKGVHLGIRFEENVYVPLTLLIDRAVNPTKTVEGLTEIKVQKAAREMIQKSSLN